jgi:hypothetical protein
MGFCDGETRILDETSLSLTSKRWMDGLTLAGGCERCRHVGLSMKLPIRLGKGTGTDGSRCGGWVTTCGGAANTL